MNASEARELLHSSLPEQMYNKLKGMPAELTLDALLQVKKDMMTSKVGEGWNIKTIQVLIHPGDKLPKLYESRVLESPLTGAKYEVQVLDILDMEWTEDGAVAVTFLGTRERVPS